MISFKNFTLRHNSKTLLNNISGEFSGSQLIGITGANGVGKTSFLRTLAGLHPGYTGSLLLFQKCLEDYSLAELAELRTYIPATIVCHWALSTRQIMTIHHKKIDFCHPLLKRLEVLPLLDQNFLTLSCGEKARVFLASALMNTTPLLILDEITSHLDDGYQGLALHLLQEQSHQGRIVICSLHQKNLALAYCDQVICLEHKSFIYLKETVSS